MQHNHDTKMQEAALLYAYGELPKEEQAAFLEHLENCEICKKTIKASALLNEAMPQIKAPDYLSMPLLKQESRKPFFSFSWLGAGLGFNKRLLAPLGAAALMIVMTLGAYEVADIYKQKSLYSNIYAEQNIDNLYDSIYDLEDEVYDIEDYIDSL